MTSESLTAKPSSRRRLKIMLLLIGLSAGVVCAELMLRLMGYGASSGRYVFDPDCGAVLVANHSEIQKTEGHALVTINSHGFRDAERTREKPVGTFRIAILGDSFCEAVQVDREETFWSLMSDQLNERLCRGDQKIEVLNFGISGYGTGQELLLYRKFAKQYDPDLVLLCFLPGNDVRNNCRQIETDTDRPFFFLRDDNLQLDNEFRNRRERRQFQNSGWLRFKDSVITNVRLARLIYNLRHQPATPQKKALECGIEDDAFFAPATPAWRAAWQLTDALILQLKHDVQADGALFVTTVLNNSIQVHPDPGIRRLLADRHNAADLSWPDEHLDQLAEAHDFPCVLLTPEMRRRAESEGRYFHGFENTELGKGHWNEAGHSVAAALLSDAVCRIISAESSD